jgi:hypothetical protein
VFSSRWAFADVLSCVADEPCLTGCSLDTSSTFMRSLLFFTLYALAFLPGTSILSFAQQDAITLPRALDQLTEEAAVIVHAFVVSTKIEPHPKLNNLTTMVVSLRVVDTYKGTPQRTLMFRQYIWDLRAQLGAAEYRKGQELILLLGPVSEYGLTSPVGLEQGRFKILRDRKGKAFAANGRGNYGLFNSVERRAVMKGEQLSPRTLALTKQSTVGPIPLADLEDAIRTFARAR